MNVWPLFSFPDPPFISKEALFLLVFLSSSTPSSTGDFHLKKKKYISGRRSRLQQHKWAHLQQVWLQGESKGLTLTLLGPPLDFPDSMPA